MGWTTSDYLLAAIADGVHVLAWQNTEDARKGRNAPKPLPRPEREKPEKTAASIGMGTAASVMTVEEFIAKREARLKKKKGA